MIEWLLPTIASAIGCVWGWRYIFRTLWEEMYKPDWSDVIMCSFLATLLCATWPLIIVGIAFKATVGQHDPQIMARRLGGRTKEQRVHDKELDRREREVHIAELERELGLEQRKP